MRSQRMNRPFHMIQRARTACLVHPRDHLAYLDLLVTFAGYCECSVHAYALMANHVHLLLSGPSLELVRELDRRIRLSHGDEAELRAVGARRYLLACMRYIELNPVRAHLVARPEDYRWSSYRANALGYNDPAVSPHALYYALGRSADERRRAYARFVERNHFRAAVSP